MAGSFRGVDGQLVPTTSSGAIADAASLNVTRLSLTLTTGQTTLSPNQRWVSRYYISCGETGREVLLPETPLRGRGDAPASPGKAGFSFLIFHEGAPEGETAQPFTLTDGAGFERVIGVGEIVDVFYSEEGGWEVFARRGITGEAGRNTATFELLRTNFVGKWNESGNLTAADQVSIRIRDDGVGELVIGEWSATPEPTRMLTFFQKIRKLGRDLAMYGWREDPGALSILPLIDANRQLDRVVTLESGATFTAVVYEFDPDDFLEGGVERLREGFDRMVMFFVDASEAASIKGVEDLLSLLQSDVMALAAESGLVSSEVLDFELGGSGVGHAEVTTTGDLSLTLSTDQFARLHRSLTDSPQSNRIISNGPPTGTATKVDIEWAGQDAQTYSITGLSSLPFGGPNEQVVTLQLDGFPALDSSFLDDGQTFRLAFAPESGVSLGTIALDIDALRERLGRAEAATTQEVQDRTTADAALDDRVDEEARNIVALDTGKADKTELDALDDRVDELEATPAQIGIGTPRKFDFGSTGAARNGGAVNRLSFDVTNKTLGLSISRAEFKSLASLLILNPPTTFRDLDNRNPFLVQRIRIQKDGTGSTGFSEIESTLDITAFRWFALNIGGDWVQLLADYSNTLTSDEQNQFGPGATGDFTITLLGAEAGLGAGLVGAWAKEFDLTPGGVTRPGQMSFLNAAHASNPRLSLYLEPGECNQVLVLNDPQTTFTARSGFSQTIPANGIGQVMLVVDAPGTPVGSTIVVPVKTSGAFFSSPSSPQVDCRLHLESPLPPTAFGGTAFPTAGRARLIFLPPAGADLSEYELTTEVDRKLQSYDTSTEVDRKIKAEEDRAIGAEGNLRLAIEEMGGIPGLGQAREFVYGNPATDRNAVSISIDPAGNSHALRFSLIVEDFRAVAGLLVDNPPSTISTSWTTREAPGEAGRMLVQRTPKTGSNLSRQEHRFEVASYRWRLWTTFVEIEAVFAGDSIPSDLLGTDGEDYRIALLSAEPEVPEIPEESETAKRLTDYRQVGEVYEAGFDLNSNASPPLAGQARLTSTQLRLRLTKEEAVAFSWNTGWKPDRTDAGPNRIADEPADAATLPNNLLPLLRIDRVGNENAGVHEDWSSITYRHITGSDDRFLDIIFDQSIASGVFGGTTNWRSGRLLFRLEPAVKDRVVATNERIDTLARTPGPKGEQGIRGPFRLHAYRRVNHGAAAPTRPDIFDFGFNPNTDVLTLPTNWTDDITSFGTLDFETYDYYTLWLQWDDATFTLSFESSPFKVDGEVGPTGSRGRRGQQGERGENGRTTRAIFTTTAIGAAAPPTPSVTYLGTGREISQTAGWSVATPSTAASSNRIVWISEWEEERSTEDVYSISGSPSAPVRVTGPVGPKGDPGPAPDGDDGQVVVLDSSATGGVTAADASTLPNGEAPDYKEDITSLGALRNLSIIDTLGQPSSPADLGTPWVLGSETSVDNDDGTTTTTTIETNIVPGNASLYIDRQGISIVMTEEQARAVLHADEFMIDDATEPTLATDRSPTTLRRLRILLDDTYEAVIPVASIGIRKAVQPAEPAETDDDGMETKAAVPAMTLGYIVDFDSDPGGFDGWGLNAFTNRGGDTRPLPAEVPVGFRIEYLRATQSVQDRAGRVIDLGEVVKGGRWYGKFLLNPDGPDMLAEGEFAFSDITDGIPRAEQEAEQAMKAAGDDGDADADEEDLVNAIDEIIALKPVWAVAKSVVFRTSVEHALRLIASNRKFGANPSAWDAGLDEESDLIRAWRVETGPFIDEQFVERFEAHGSTPGTIKVTFEQGIPSFSFYPADDVTDVPNFFPKDPVNFLLEGMNREEARFASQTSIPTLLDGQGVIYSRGALRPSNFPIGFDVFPIAGQVPIPSSAGIQWLGQQMPIRGGDGINVRIPLPTRTQLLAGRDLNPNEVYDYSVRVPNLRAEYVVAGIYATGGGTIRRPQVGEHASKGVDCQLFIEVLDSAGNASNPILVGYADGGLGGGRYLVQETYDDNGETKTRPETDDMGNPTGREFTIGFGDLIAQGNNPAIPADENPANPGMGDELSDVDPTGSLDVNFDLFGIFPSSLMRRNEFDIAHNGPLRRFNGGGVRYYNLPDFTSGSPAPGPGEGFDYLGQRGAYREIIVNTRGQPVNLIWRYSATSIENPRVSGQGMFIGDGPDDVAPRPHLIQEHGAPVETKTEEENRIEYAVPTRDTLAAFGRIAQGRLAGDDVSQTTLSIEALVLRQTLGVTAETAARIAGNLEFSTVRNIIRSVIVAIAEQGRNLEASAQRSRATAQSAAAEASRQDGLASQADADAQAAANAQERALAESRARSAREAAEAARAQAAAETAAAEEAEAEAKALSDAAAAAEADTATTDAASREAGTGTTSVGRQNYRSTTETDVDTRELDTANPDANVMTERETTSIAETTAAAVAPSLSAAEKAAAATAAQSREAAAATAKSTAELAASLAVSRFVSSSRIAQVATDPSTNPAARVGLALATAVNPAVGIRALVQGAVAVSVANALESTHAEAVAAHQRAIAAQTSGIVDPVTGVSLARTPAERASRDRGGLGGSGRSGPPGSDRSGV